MAKPGTRAARQVSRGVDLRGKALTDKQAQTVQEGIELTRGTRCFHCGRRIGMGFRFTSIDPRDLEDPIMQLSACSRNDCEGAQLARQGATYVEPVDYAWLDENGIDAPACKVRRQQSANDREEVAPGAGA